MTGHLAALTSVHVATDWPAFGLFFLGLVTTAGGFSAWLIRRLDKNRADWKEFVAKAVEEATAQLKMQVQTLASSVDDNSREIRDQGKAVARIEGRLGTNPASQSPI